MSKVIIFGYGDNAELAYYYLTHDSPHEVVAFSVTSEFCDKKEFRGLPLIAFEEVQEIYPPGDYQFFVPASGRSMNRLREKYFLAAKEKGYRCVSYISSKAITCQNEIGENCFILEHTNIQPFVQVGDNTIIWCNTHVGHHSLLEGHTFIGSNVVICGRCQIGTHCYLASSSIINDYVKLPQGTLVGSMSFVRSAREPWGIYTGNPAKRRKQSSKDFDFL